MLVTELRYRAITGDTTTVASAVEEAIVQATEALEDQLDRPLAEDERTEQLRPSRDGWLWPKATPIASVDGSYEVVGDGIRGNLPWAGAPFVTDSDPVTITYTGGFVERSEADPGDPARLPVYIERDLAFAAWRVLHPPALGTDVPAGASSARVGDVAVTYGPGGAQATTDVLERVWSAKTLAWRYRPIGGPP